MRSLMALLVTILALTLSGPIYGQGAASGTVTIDKDKFEIKYAAAARVPDPHDKTKWKTRIVLADKPIPDDILDDEVQIWDLKSQGYHGLELELGPGKESYALIAISSTVSGTFTRSGSFDSKRFSVLTDKRVEGSMESAPEETAGIVMGYSLKFAVNVMPPEPAPTAADAAAAAGKESVKSYLALMEAIRTGNKQKIMEMSPPDKRAAIDTPEFPQMLKMVQEMTPQKIQVLKAAETGNRAKLLTRGIQDGETKRGRILLTRVNGKWILQWEAWSAE